LNILLNPGDTIVANFGQGTQCYTLGIINPIPPQGGTTPITQVFNGNNCDAEVCTNYCNPTPTPTTTPTPTPTSICTSCHEYTISNVGVNCGEVFDYLDCYSQTPEQIPPYFFSAPGSQPLTICACQSPTSVCSATIIDDGPCTLSTSCYCYEFTISPSDISELGTVAVNAQNCSADYVSLTFPASGIYHRCLMRVLSDFYFIADYSVAPNSSYTGPNAPCRNDGECA
jgi:hypothetical protein